MTLGNNSQDIDVSAVEFDSASAVDNFGRVFHYNGEVYRAVTEEGAQFCHDILKNAGKWKRHGLVGTWKSPINLQGFPMTVQHEKVHFRNYCMEWLPNMFKDAALQFLKLNLRLVKDGFVCKDGHPWNIFFDYAKPVYIDIGSIVPYSREVLERRCIWEFKLYFLLPIVFFRKEGFEKTYEFLRMPIPNHEYRESVASRMLDNEFFKSLDFSNPKSTLKKLMRYVSNLDICTEIDTKWSKYNQRPVSYKKPGKFAPKQKAAYDFLISLQKGDLLDIGCNNGWFSLLAERMGFKVVGIDNDLPSISRLYEQAKKKRLNTLTLYGDMKHLTPAHGVGGGHPSFEERFSFDVVLAMAVVHHLSYKAKMHFDELSERISRLSRKHVIIEFIPREDYYVRKWDQTGVDWYTRENFIGSFLKHFREYSVVESSPDPREVFIFSK